PVGEQDAEPARGHCLREGQALLLRAVEAGHVDERWLPRLGARAGHEPGRERAALVGHLDVLDRRLGQLGEPREGVDRAPVALAFARIGVLHERDRPLVVAAGAQEALASATWMIGL